MSKRTKRVRGSSETLSLEEHISEKRASLVASREEAPSLRRRAASLRERASSFEGVRHLQRARKDLLRRADEIEAEADERETMRREHEFERTVVSYLRTYHRAEGRRGGKDGGGALFGAEGEGGGDGATRDGGDAPAPRLGPTTGGGGVAPSSVQEYVQSAYATKARRASILDEYLVEMQNAPPKVAMAVRDECPHCDGRKLLLCASKSILSCPACGYTMTYLDATSSSTSFDDVIEYSPYSYKRVNHYMTWVTHVQGKEAYRVPDDVLRSVMADLYDRQRVRAATDITQRRVRDALRHLRLRRAYDHVAQVTARLSGVRSHRLTPEVEEKLKKMFLQMQPAFQRHAPRSRTNFLSYSYVLYRCFQILGLEHMLEGITLLKGRDKLEANDAIFRRMCEDLGWPLFNLPPASETVR